MTDVRLEVLGSSPAWPSPGRACTGYLLHHGDNRLLLDCGTGVFARLRSVVRPEDIDTIALSHLHFDHWVDLIPYTYYLTLEARADRRLPLRAPPGAAETLDEVVGPIVDSPGFFAGAFEVGEYQPDRTEDWDGVRVSFLRTRHPGETYALRLEVGATTIVYSADTGWTPALGEFARGAELFLCEAAFGAVELAPSDVHLTAGEAGRLAAQAGVGRLAITHVAEAQVRASLQAAEEEFGGRVEHAAEGAVFHLGAAARADGTSA